MSRALHITAVVAGLLAGTICLPGHYRIAAGDASVPAPRDKARRAPERRARLLQLDEFVARTAPALSEYARHRNRRKGDSLNIVSTGAIIDSDAMRRLRPRWRPSSRQLLDPRRYRITLECDDKDLCAQGLDVKGAEGWIPLIDARALLQQQADAIRKEQEGEDEKLEVEETSIVAVIGEGRPGQVSVWRGSTRHTRGAAHAWNQFWCETWDVKSRRRLHPGDVLGERAAGIVARAREAAADSMDPLRDHVDAGGGFKLEDDWFLLHAEPGGATTISFCATSSTGAGGSLLELPMGAVDCQRGCGPTPSQ